ncbi:hypothetical protein CEXT_41681 [Caerostris extrusa]|uniref:Uncharacterized protein n=1 Tax=Caerostris extrusa TaxID=172846 RepID=A0AAV4XV44_CAEEX|nr:hypothetical protein CEXT_41681 [Caerostris extrusa]
MAISSVQIDNVHARLRKHIHRFLKSLPRFAPDWFLRRSFHPNYMQFNSRLSTPFSSDKIHKRQGVTSLCSMTQLVGFF